ncbi:MAG: prolyl-tRNA synthetase associated domain-containing protein [Asgard group archaeon]|nr:prolyl-tRNA synthetase associated domain-containing protein [Asgard group archaeon]
MDNQLVEWLEQYQIEYKLHTHPAVFTIEEAKKHCSHIPGLHCKNLFLKDIKRRQYFLITIPAEKRLDFKEFAKKVNLPFVKLADDNELQNLLGLSKGAVSPLGLINDVSKKVAYYIDKEVFQADRVTFHPNINTETLELSKEAYHQMIKCTGNKFIVDNFGS